MEAGEKAIDIVEVAETSARGGFSLFIGNASSTVILAIGSILIARFLGPSGCGVYSLSLVAPALLGSLISLGIDSAVIRFPAKFKAESRPELTLGILSSALTFRLITGAMMSLLCFLCSDFLAAHLLNRPEIGFYVKLASILVLFQTLFNLVYSAFIGLDRAWSSSLINALMSMIKASTAPMLIILGLSVTGAIMGHILGYAVAGVIGTFLLYLGPCKTLKSLKNMGEDGGFLENLGMMVGYGLPLYLSSILLLVMGQYQLILLTYYVSNVEIGSFQAAVNLASLLVIVVTPIATALFPAFSKLSLEDQELRRFFNLSVKYSSLLVIPTAMAVIFLSGELVNVTYGGGYRLTALYLPVYASTFLLTGLGYGIIDSFFNGVGETRLTLRIYLVSLAVFIPLAPLLTAIYGVLGMITALLVSNLARTIYGLALARKRFRVYLSLQEQLRIYLSSALSSLPILMLLSLRLGTLPNLVMGPALYLLTYLTLTPVLKAIDEQDLQNLKQIFRKVKFVQPMIKLAISYESRLLAFTSHINKWIQ